jgi:signal transduction histidine kinase
VNLVRPDGDLEVAAVCASEEGRALVGQLGPRDEWERLLSLCEPHGALRLLHSERFASSEFERIPSFVEPGDPATCEDAWLPEDTVLAPLFDHDGGLVGVLSVDQPAGGLWPRPEQLELLEMYAAQAAVAIDKARLHAEVAAREADKSELLARLLAAQEEAQARLALDLHDGPVQSLSAVVIQLGHIASMIERGETGRAVEALAAAGQEVSAQVEGLRKQMIALRPHVLDERGLMDALTLLADEFEASYRRRCRVRGGSLPPVPAEVSTALFRIAREAIGNAGRHAAPSDVEVEVRVESSAIALTVADHGPGMHPDQLVAHGHLGLPSMRERAEALGGCLRVDSRVGEGTLVAVTIPRS